MILGSEDVSQRSPNYGLWGEERSLAIALVNTIFKALVSLNTVYVLTGLVLLVFAALNFKDRSNKHRYGTALFWLILGLIFILGSVLPHWSIGVYWP